MPETTKEKLDKNERILGGLYKKIEIIGEVQIPRVVNDSIEKLNVELEMKIQEERIKVMREVLEKLRTVTKLIV